MLPLQCREMVAKLCYKWADMDEVHGKESVSPEAPKPVAEAKPYKPLICGYGIAARRRGASHIVP